MNATPEMADSDSRSFVELRLTAQDLIDGKRQHISTRAGLIRLAIFFVVGVVAGYILTRDLLLSAFLMTVIIIGSLLLVTVISFVLIPWSERRVYAKTPLHQLPRRIALRADGIETQSERAHGMLRWGDFVRWRSNARTTLIYVSPQQYLLFPARLASLGFPLDELKAALTRELGPPKR